MQMRGVGRLRGVAAAWLAAGCAASGGGSGSASTGGDGTGGSATDSAMSSSDPADDTTAADPGTDAGTASTSVDADTSSGSESDTGEPPGLGPLVVDREHPHVFRREGGDPVFLCGPAEAEDFLFRGTLLPDGTRDGDQDDLVAALAASGANAVAITAVRSHGGDGDATQNPFVAGDPAQGSNDAVLDQWDGWLATLNEAGVTVLFYIYDDVALVWDTGDAVGAEEQAFLEALVDRFEHHPLIVWVVAENYSEAMSAARASAIASIIAARDDAGHPIGIGQVEGVDFDFARDPAIDSFQVRHDAIAATAIHGALVSNFASAQDRYNVTMAQVEGHGTGASARAFSWAAATAGAYVNVYDQDIATTAPADLEDCGRLVEFFGATRFPEMSPHDELAAEGTTWVFARPSEAYVLFGVSSPATLGLSDLPAATWHLSWFDPAAGTWIEEELRHPGGPASLAVPAGFGLHAALYVELG